MAVTNNALSTTQPSTTLRSNPAIELTITMMEARSNQDGDREFHFWGRMSAGQQGRAVFTVPGTIGCDVIVAVERQLQLARAITARGRWISKNVGQAKNVWTFRIEAIDSISLTPGTH